MTYVRNEKDNSCAAGPGLSRPEEQASLLWPSTAQIRSKGKKPPGIIATGEEKTSWKLRGEETTSCKNKNMPVFLHVWLTSCLNNELTCTRTQRVRSPIVNTFQKRLWTSLPTAIVIKWILTIMCSHYLGNPEAPAGLLWKWRAWAGNGTSSERTIKSFKKCGRSNSTNGTKDDILWKKRSRMGKKRVQQSGDNIKCR